MINKKLMEGKEHMIRNEIAVLRRISIGHANILTLVDYFETLNNCKALTHNPPSQDSKRAPGGLAPTFKSRWEEDRPFSPLDSVLWSLVSMETEVVYLFLNVCSQSD